jgi:hypothetical protein
MSSNGIQTVNASDADYEARIAEINLPETVLSNVEEYEAVGGERDRFVWKWIYSLLPEFTLSSVPREHAGSVRTQKTNLTILITLLDDLAEKRGDTRTFDAIRRVVTGGESDDARRSGNREIVDFADRLWSEIESGLVDAPRHEETREIFDYDLRQALNAMDYSRMINDHLSMANLEGTEHYGPHNMVMFPYADIDLMHSPSFEFADFGELRELIWGLQKMARIGNWLTTWEREIHEGDYTAGIVVYALRNDIVTYEELRTSGPERRTELVERIKERGVEDRFMDEWRQRHRALTEKEYQADSVDLNAFIEGMETVMEHHLASRGYK